MIFDSPQRLLCFWILLDMEHRAAQFRTLSSPAQSPQAISIIRHRQPPHALPTQNGVHHIQPNYISLNLKIRIDSNA